MWKEGIFDIEEYAFLWEAKVYDEGSIYGIDCGRISKLLVKRVNRLVNTLDDITTVIHYDRGWDIRPTDDIDKVALKYLLDLFK